MIKPYLVESEKLFGIKLDDLLTHNGKKLAPAEAVKVSADTPGSREHFTRLCNQTTSGNSGLDFGV